MSASAQGHQPHFACLFWHGARQDVAAGQLNLIGEGQDHPLQ